MTDLRILITGSRGWDDKALLADALASVIHWWVSQHPEADAPPVMTLVHGDCPDGADMLAQAFAEAAGLRTERHPAKWREGGTYDVQAGFRRNAEMVALGADVCVAFAGPCAKYQHRDDPPHMSHGTDHCARLAQAAGIQTWYVRPDGTVSDH